MLAAPVLVDVALLQIVAWPVGISLGATTAASLLGVLPGEPCCTDARRPVRSGAGPVGGIQVRAEQKDGGDPPRGLLHMADLLGRERAPDDGMVAVAEPFLEHLALVVVVAAALTAMDSTTEGVSMASIETGRELLKSAL